MYNIKNKCTTITYINNHQLKHMAYSRKMYNCDIRINCIIPTCQLLSFTGFIKNHQHFFPLFNFQCPGSALYPRGLTQCHSLESTLNCQLHLKLTIYHRDYNQDDLSHSLFDKLFGNFMNVASHITLTNIKVL